MQFLPPSISLFFWVVLRTLERNGAGDSPCTRAVLGMGGKWRTRVHTPTQYSRNRKEQLEQQEQQEQQEQHGTTGTEGRTSNSRNRKEQLKQKGSAGTQWNSRNSKERQKQQWTAGTQRNSRNGNRHTHTHTDTHTHRHSHALQPLTKTTYVYDPLCRNCQRMPVHILCAELPSPPETEGYYHLYDKGLDSGWTDCTRNFAFPLTIYHT